MKLLIAILLFFSASAMAADECIMQARIRGFQSNSNTTLEIDAGLQDYKMTVFYCQQLPWAHNIAFRSFSGSRVCRMDKLLILDNFSNRVIDQCTIQSIEKIQK